MPSTVTLTPLLEAVENTDVLVLHALFGLLRKECIEACTAADIFDFTARVAYVGVISVVNVAPILDVEPLTLPDVPPASEEPLHQVTPYPHPERWNRGPTFAYDGTSFSSFSDIATIPFTRPTNEPAACGLVFLTEDTQASWSIGLGTHQLSVGVALEPSVRGRGIAKVAVNSVVRLAFDHLKAHRVTATILDRPSREESLALFTSSNFVYEGTHRRAFFSPFDQKWNDITVLAILDTEYLLRLAQSSRALPPVLTFWDTMLARHQREREELLKWDDDREGAERPQTLARSSSTDTIHVQYSRDAIDIASPGPPSPVDIDSDVHDDDVSDITSEYDSDASHPAIPSRESSVSDFDAGREMFRWTAADILEASDESDGNISSSSSWDRLSDSSSDSSSDEMET